MSKSRLASLALCTLLPLLATSSSASANLEFERQWPVDGLPTSLDLDASGDVYVSVEGDEIIGMDPRGVETFRWGSFGVDNSQFNSISGIAIDRADGLLYATERFNHRIQKFFLSGGFIQKWGTTGPAAGQVTQPSGIAAASDGTVYVTERGNHRVQHFSDIGSSLRTWGSFGYEDATEFDQPKAIAVGPNDHVFVGDLAGRIREFDAFGTFIKRFGVQDPTAADGLEDGGFGSTSGVAGLAVDSNGLIYAVDRDHDRIQVFRPDGTFLSKLGSPGSGPGRFDEPVDVAVGPDDRVYIAERGNGRVQVLSNAVERPPEAVERPPNNFSFAGRTINRRRGFAVLRVSVPGAGRVQLLRTARNRPASVQAQRKSVVRVKVTAKGRSLRLLRKRKRLVVQVKVEFTPVGGIPRTKKTRVTLALG